jgi:hypothetical protein
MADGGGVGQHPSGWTVLKCVEESLEQALENSTARPARAVDCDAAIEISVEVSVEGAGGRLVAHQHAQLPVQKQASSVKVVRTDGADHAVNF